MSVPAGSSIRATMLFASTDLAARIERAECSLLTDCAAAVARRRAGADVLVQPIAGGVAVFTVDGAPMNKLAGLGFGGAVPEEELAQVEQVFQERGAPLQVELSNLADPAVGAMLTRRGYTLEGYENVLGRPLPASDLPASPPDDIEIATSGDDELDTWLDVVVTGFATPDTQGVASHESFESEALREIVADLASANTFVRYLARRDGAAAGGASMRICENILQLTGAATLPEHRRRGVQTALLARRLGDASDAGCDIAVVTTQPGSKSHENVQRQGFELLYTRAMLLRHPG